MCEHTQMLFAHMLLNTFYSSHASVFSVVVYACICVYSMCKRRIQFWPRWLLKRPLVPIITVHCKQQTQKQVKLLYLAKGDDRLLGVKQN